jgi:formate hydrogenlyase transcriptional activator
MIPIHASVCGKAFRTGQAQHYHDFEELGDDPESFGSSVGNVSLNVSRPKT